MDGFGCFIRKSGFFSESLVLSLRKVIYIFVLNNVLVKHFATLGRAKQFSQYSKRNSLVLSPLREFEVFFKVIPMLWRQMTWQLRHKSNPLVWWQWINKQIDKYEEACIVYSLIPRGCKDKLYTVKVKTNSVKKKVIARKRNTFMTKHVLGLKQETTWYIYRLPVLSIQSRFDTSLLSRVVNSSTYLT